MKQDLVAPQRFSPKAFAKVVAAITGITLVLCIGMTLHGNLTAAQLAIRAPLLILLAVAAIYAQARLSKHVLLARPERKPIFNALMGTVGLTLFGAQVTLAFPFVPMPWWQIPFMFGFMLAGGGVTRRFGESLHCPACDYECNFDDASDTPIRCPECGTPWLGRLKKGRKIRSTKLIALGLSLGLASAVLLNPIFYMPTLGPYLPTPLLYSILYVAPRSDFRSWGVLASRPLTQHSIDAMARRALALRDRDQYDRPPSQWLEAMIAARKVPQDLANRYFRESFQATLLVPKQVKVGEPFTAQLRVTRATSGRGTMGLMFAGFALDDSPPRLGRQDKTLWPHELQPGFFDRYRDVLPQSLTADHTGDTYVRAVYWLVYQPSFMDELSWQPDGTPATPPHAVWFERFELEQTLHVQ